MMELYLRTKDYELKTGIKHYLYNPTYQLWHIHTINGNDMFIYDWNVVTLLIFEEGETIVYSAMDTMH